jgi:hypothetical protein
LKGSQVERWQGGKVTEWQCHWVGEWVGGKLLMTGWLFGNFFHFRFEVIPADPLFISLSTS